MTVAALYVQAGGCYFELDGVDPWDEARDARLLRWAVAGGGASAVRAVGAVLGRSTADVAAPVARR